MNFQVIGDAIPIAVSLGRIGAQPMHLNPISQAVLVGIGIIGVGLVDCFQFII